MTDYKPENSSFLGYDSVYIVYRYRHTNLHGFIFVNKNYTKCKLQAVSRLYIVVLDSALSEIRCSM